jgi:hypothetical protein
MLQNKDEPPSMIVAGSATWSIKDSNASVRALQEYSLNLTRLVQVTETLKCLITEFHNMLKIMWQ